MGQTILLSLNMKPPPLYHAIYTYYNNKLNQYIHIAKQIPIIDAFIHKLINYLFIEEIVNITSYI